MYLYMKKILSILRYYESVDLENYKNKTRRITTNFPFINARNEEI